MTDSKPPDPKPEVLDCSVREILDHVGNKWPALVIYALSGGSLRFGEIKRRIHGISQRMLTETVRSLERDGVVLRTVYPTIPPKVEYSLTSLGESFLPLVMALVHWALENRAEIHGSRSTFDNAQKKPVTTVQVHTLDRLRDLAGNIDCQTLPKCALRTKNCCLLFLSKLFHYELGYKKEPS